MFKESGISLEESEGSKRGKYTWVQLKFLMTSLRLLASSTSKAIHTKRRECGLLDCLRVGEF